MSDSLIRFERIKKAFCTLRNLKVEAHATDWGAGAPIAVPLNRPELYFSVRELSMLEDLTGEKVSFSPAEPPHFPNPRLKFSIRSFREVDGVATTTGIREDLQIEVREALYEGVPLPEIVRDTAFGMSQVLGWATGHSFPAEPMIPCALRSVRNAVLRFKEKNTRER